MEYKLLKIEGHGFCLLRSDYKMTWVCSNPTSLIGEFKNYEDAHLPSIFKDCKHETEECVEYLNGITQITTFKEEPTLQDLISALPEYYV